jgi:hypothetical protein
MWKAMEHNLEVSIFSVAVSAEQEKPHEEDKYGIIFRSEKGRPLLENF